MARKVVFASLFIVCPLFGNHNRNTVFIRGDANMDQMLDITDAIVVLEGIFLGGAILCEDAADTDDNGKIDITDAIAILELLFAQGVELSYPTSQGFGPDPTTDLLNCESGMGMPFLAIRPFSGSDKILSPDQGLIEILKFSVQAGSVNAALAKFTFRIVTTTVDLRPDSLTLWVSENPDDEDLSVVSGCDDFSTFYTDPWQAFAESRLDVGNDDIQAHNDAGEGDSFLIPSETIWYFTLCASFNGHDATIDNEAVSVSILGDKNAAGIGQLSILDIEESPDNDFIWAPLNADQDADEAVQKSIWLNGFKTPGIEWHETLQQTITD